MRVNKDLGSVYAEIRKKNHNNSEKTNENKKSKDGSDIVTISDAVAEANKDSVMSYSESSLRMIRIMRDRKEELLALESKDVSEDVVVEERKKLVLLPQFDSAAYDANLEKIHQSKVASILRDNEGNAQLSDLLKGAGTIAEKASRVTGQYIQQMQMYDVMQRMEANSSGQNVDFNRFNSFMPKK